MHILPGYYKFIWHITKRIFPPKFSEWTTLQIFEVRGKSYFVVQVLLIKVIWLLPKKRNSPKSGQKMCLFFWPVCWEFRKSSLLNKYILEAKGGWIKYVATLPSNHLATNHCFEWWWMWNFSASFLISQMPKFTFSKYPYY